MNPEITMEQQAQLNTWASKRDAILLEISGLENIKGVLLKTNIEIAESNKDIEDRMKVIQGRIEELTIKEKELPAMISKEVASLISQRTTLESEITLLKDIVNILSKQKESLNKDIASEFIKFELVKGNALSLEKVVAHVIKVSEGNEEKINSIVKNLGKSLEEIIEVNKKNVFETNIVIDKLPRMLVEIQKKGLIKQKI